MRLTKLHRFLSVLICFGVTEYFSVRLSWLWLGVSLRRSWKGLYKSFQRTRLSCIRRQRDNVCGGEET